MSKQDSSTSSPPASLSGLVATLAPVALIAGVYLVIFLVLRRSQRRFYAPRTYLGSLRESERTPSLPNGLLNWFGAFWRLPDVHALQHQSLDAYFFLRFLRMTVVICFVGCCITWPVLFPVNATGSAGQAQLDVLSFSNIGSDQKSRYYAHVFISWSYLGFIMYLIMRECIYYINLRQAFLLSPMYANRISSRTVLFTSVPAAYLDEARLRKVFGDSVKHIWITCDSESLDKLVEERDKVAFRLEKAEVNLIKKANKARAKAIKTSGGDANEHTKETAPKSLDAESGSLAARWISAAKRPTHRTGLLGLFGKKVDSINWCRTELERLIPAVQTAQHDYRAGTSKKIPGVFIEFHTQADAEAAAQVLTHHQGLEMTPRFIGVTPSEVVWKALALPWHQRLLRGYTVTLFIVCLIVFWAIPVAVVGAISNVQNLEGIAFLTWLKKIPDVIMGVVTGLLPSVALSILMSLVPVIMRLCAKLAGEPSLSRAELFCQSWYFVFQVVQVFLITTVTSSAAAVGYQISQNPAMATSLLSQNLPKASNFYISYFIVQGLSVAAGVISQVVGFVIFMLLYKYLAGTPRALYSQWANLSAISWGSVLPVYTNITVIAITYSSIAPLVLGFATCGMGLFYLAYRYNVLFVTETKVDTRGLIYPCALKQLFTGLYLAEVCMIGLFGTAVAPGPLILMVIFLVFTVLFHISLNTALNPLLSHLPMSLLAEEGHNLLDAETRAAEAGTHSKTVVGATAITTATPSTAKANMLTRFLKPWQYDDYATLKALVPVQSAATADMLYSEEAELNAYYPPSVTAAVPLLWVPKDPAGISKQEVAHTSKVIPITDEGCELNDKGNLEWDRESSRPPVWEEKVVY